MIMSECVVSNTTQSVTQYTINDETYKSTIIDGSHYHLNSDFLLRITTVTVLLLRYTPPAASQTTHCYGYGYCWLWRYKSGCVIVICHVACIVLCRPKHSVSRRHRAAHVESQIVPLFPQSLTIRVVCSVLNDARRRYEKCIVLGQ